ncbi:MAG TPA: hypothetical protein VF797_21650 [Noviherbaspirillum sp.]
MAKTKTKAIKARQNIWGNWIIYIGNERDACYADQFDAVLQLAGMLTLGKYHLSPKSEIRQESIDALNNGGRHA